VLVFRRLLLPGLVLFLCSFGTAQQKSKVELESNETIFTVVTAMNACDYDDGLNASDPLRKAVRDQVNAAIERSKEAGDIAREMCGFYREHHSGDTGELSQYISLALNLGGPPDFKPKVKEADLPPDTNYVLGFVPLMARFAAAVNLHAIWLRAQPRYEALIDKFHEALANMVLQTDLYLKNPISGYLGRQFIIYIEPMTGPGQVNARNYGDDYFLVTAPVNDQLPMQNVQHTYLHFILDPLALKRPAAMKRLQPLLKTVQSAPLEDSFKYDVTLLVTESLIRAVEARLTPGGKNAEAKRQDDVNNDMREGFILTRYFYDNLVKFEQEPTGLKDAFPDFLYYLDVGHEAKRASEIQFDAKGRGEVVKGKIREQRDPLALAQQKMAEGDYPAAEKTAHDVLTQNGADAPRASLILGQIATLNRDEDQAIQYFEKTLQMAKDPGLIAWAHIYLGRIYDVDQERDMAVKHYQAALRAGDETPQTQAAAKKGLESPYQRRAASEQDQ
jgi:tetratricopeptide (TPR) repeat protein